MDISTIVSKFDVAGRAVGYKTGQLGFPENGSIHNAT